MLRVETLHQCVAMIRPAFFLKRNEDILQHCLMWKLRQYFAGIETGHYPPVAASCPAMQPEACFDDNCPSATSVGLKGMVSHPCWHVLGGRCCFSYV